MLNVKKFREKLVEGHIESFRQLFQDFLQLIARRILDRLTCDSESNIF